MADSIKALHEGVGEIPKLPIALKKPIVFLDIEATGPDPALDRIIEIHCIRYEVDGTAREFYSLVNPGEPIPIESTRIHGFTNKDLSSSPGFKKISNELFDFLKNADLGGYNVLRFDVRILYNEFKRVNLNYELADIRAIDPFQIYVKNHKRDLTSAYQFYCGKELVGAHGAKADNIAAIEVFLEQMKKYSDIPDSVDGVSDYCMEAGEPYLDPERFLIWKNDQVVINFGKHKGRLLKEIVSEDHNFLFWVTKNNFNPVLIRMIKDALKGNYPVRKKIARADDSE